MLIGYIFIGTIIFVIGAAYVLLDMLYQKIKESKKPIN